MVNTDPAGVRRQRSRVVFGLAVIAFGVAALLENLGVLGPHLLQTWWPLVFVALGAVRLLQGPPAYRVIFSIGLIALGAAMTASNLGVLQFHARDWWPLLVIFVGGSVIARAFHPGDAERWRRTRGHHRDERFEHDARIDASAVMSGIVLKNDSQDFQGGSISTMMGSVQVDLRQAAIATQASLHLSVVMGGVEIKVPRDWSVSIAGTPMLGGIEDRTVPPAVPRARLVIEGSVVMGGVEISN
jgi:predicted membrane protein